MADEISNWRDATNVAMPPCPNCGNLNAPGGTVYVQKFEEDYHCNACGHAWPLAARPLMLSELRVSDLDLVLQLAYDFLNATGRPMKAKELQTHLRRPGL